MPKAQETHHLPRLIVKDGSAFATSRDIAEFVEKDHRNVCQAVKNLRKKYTAACARAAKEGKTIPEGGMLTFQQTPYVDEQNSETYLEYVLDRNTAIALILGLNGEKAMLWQLSYIAAFNAMEAELSERQTIQPPTAPVLDMRNPIQLAKAFAQVMEIAQEAEARAADEAAQKALAIQLIDEMTPKVTFAEEVQASIELTTMRNAARACEVSEKEFFDYIKAKKYVFYEDGQLVPYAHHLQSGLFRVKYPTANGKVRPQTFVTGKGISVLKSAFIAKRNDLLSALRSNRVPDGVTRPTRPALPRTIN